MAKKKSKKKDDKYALGGLLFVGSLMLGLATGLYFGRPDVGVLGGLGIGFILMGLAISKKK